MFRRHRKQNLFGTAKNKKIENSLFLFNVPLKKRKIVDIIAFGKQGLSIAFKDFIKRCGMRRKEKALSFLLTSALLLSSTAISINAQGAEADVIDGIPTVFVTAFGRMSYDGQSRQAFKTLDEGLSALGEEGGKIVLQGNGTLGNTYTSGTYENLCIEGIGSKASGNCVTVNDSELMLTGNLELYNICLNMLENGVIITNGHKFTAGDGFDSYFKETYVSGGENVVSYPSPVSVAAGDFTEGAEIELYSGTYKNISAGYNGASGSGDVVINIDGVNAGSVIFGASDGMFEMNGNVVLNISGDTDIEVLSGGSGNIKGSIFAVFGGNISVKQYDFKQDLSVSGKKTAVVYDSTEIPDGFFDNNIILSEGRAEPVFDNGELTGVKFYDKNGFLSDKILLNGNEQSSETGIFDIPNGESKVKPISSVEISLNDDAVLVGGYEDGTFRPQNNMTRAEAITVLARLIADENIFKNIVSADYEDVAGDAWYSPYIGLFQQLGYLENLEEDEKIFPDQKITRGEFCELIANMYPIVTTRLNGTKSFPDVYENYRYKSAVELAGFTGIVGGYEDGTFRPDNLVTRAEVVTMINRMIGRIPSESSVTVFSDIEGHWAQSQINAAGNTAEKDGVIMWTKGSINKFDEYMQYRSSLTNTRLKLENEKKLNVAFIGGSITAGSGASDANSTSWRARTVEWFKNTYPDCEINQVNAAIGDSYTKYAVYRMDNDLLKYDYDILFVEYAINDSPWYSAKEDTETIVYFETLIRRVYEHNPKADIVIVYTIDDKISRLPEYFPTAAAQEVIAEYYDIPSVNFGRALADYIAENNLKWEDCFADYVHPNDDGHLYYGAVVTEYLENALKAENCGDTITDRVLPPQHTEQKLWYDLTMLEANEIDLSLSKNWALSEDGSKIYPTAADNELVVKTYGSDICIASPRDDTMYYSVDGGQEQYMKMNRKPQTLAEGLSDGEHILRIRADDITKLSIQRLMYNGKQK